MFCRFTKKMEHYLPAKTDLNDRLIILTLKSE